MKTSTFKAILILSGLMLTGIQSMHAGITDQFSNSISNELSHFHMQSLFVIFGIIAAGLAFYFLTHKPVSEEKTIRHRISYSQQRRHHHRAVIKKTA